MTASADQEVKPMLLAHRKPEFLWAGQPASGLGHHRKPETMERTSRSPARVVAQEV